MGATFSRLKNWIAEILTYADLNAEIDNILNNLGPAGVDDYSTNATQMRIVTDPGEVGSESLATSLAGELERLRFAIKEIKGSDVAQWYETADTSLSDLRTLLAGAVQRNYISSGTESARSSQLIALTPSGSTTSITLQGAPTNFVAYIDGSQYSVTADVTITGLSAAPSAGNTCLIDDASASSTQYTKHLGEYGTVIGVDTMGTAITSFVGKLAGFKLVSGGNTEYFIAHVNSTSQITKARRGFMHDSSGAAIPSIAFSNNNTLTLCRPTWLFLNTAGSLIVTYNQPTYAATQPSGPATGDYWFDIPNQTWKTFNSVSWVTASATVVGMSLQDTVACVAARTFDQATSLIDTNTVDLQFVSTTQIQVKNYGARLSVFGTSLNYEMFRPTWDMTANLDTGVSESASNTYYFYLKESGAPVISDLSPTDRRGDLFGYYHPTETWRCVGHAFNNGSSNLTASSLVAFSRSKEVSFFSNDDAPVGDMKMLMSATPAPGWEAADGASISRFRYWELFSDGVQAIGTAAGTANVYAFNKPLSMGRVPRGWDNAAGIDPDAAGRSASATGGNTGDALGTIQADAFQGHSHQLRDGATWNGGNLVGKAAGGAATASITHVDAGAAGNAAQYFGAEAVTNNAHGTPLVTTETRMRNFTVLYAIKVAQ